MAEEQKLSDREKREFEKLIKTLGRSSTELSQNPFDMMLVKNMGLNGAAGVYLLRSFELMLQMGKNYDETVQEHERMANILRQSLTMFLKKQAPELETAESFRSGSPIIKH